MTRVVAITGASAGVGRAAARKFAEQGASVALLARGEQGLAAAAREAESDLESSPSGLVAAESEHVARRVPALRGAAGRIVHLELAEATQLHRRRA